MSDLRNSIAFYRDLIGLSVETDTPHPDTALLTTFQNHRFMLAGPDAPDWSEILAEEHTILKPGEKVFMWDPEFDQRLERLEQDGTVEVELIERPWDDRMIEAVDPDGYGITLQAMVARSPDDVLNLIQMARDGLRQRTAGLTEAELSWRPDPDSWSVREVVHHLADANLTVLHAARVALAEPGKAYRSNPYDQNQYASELRYRERDIEPAFSLYEATADVLCSMVEAVPDGWDRIVTSSDQETTVQTYLEMMAIHALEHLEQIADVRRAMGR